MEEKFCENCGKTFAGEGELCEECLAKTAEAAPVEEPVQQEEMDSVESIEAENDDEEEALKASQFYVDYEEIAPKVKSGAKITAMILGLVGCLYGIYYVIMLVMNTIQQNAMMAQYGMASQLGIIDFIPFIIMAVYFICGIVGSVLPKKAAKASLILLLIPASWTLFNGLQLVTSLIPTPTAQQTVPVQYVVMYTAFLAAGIFCLVAGILHAVYLTYKHD